MVDFVFLLYIRISVVSVKQLYSDVVSNLYLWYIFIVYLGSTLCYTNASHSDPTPPHRWPPRQTDTYTCKFPFTYQGEEYNKKCAMHDKYSTFCAIEPIKPSHGFPCPNCWPNETYRIGYCDHGDQCGFREYHYYF